MHSRFHLAIKVTDLPIAKSFYCDILGCEEGRSEDDWQDINFFGNELTLHECSDYKPNKNIEGKIVDMCDIPVPHFGVHLSESDFSNLKQRVQNNDVNVLLDPFVRFEGRPPEQETMFLSDPFNYVIEVKCMKNPETLWDLSS